MRRLVYFRVFYWVPTTLMRDIALGIGRYESVLVSLMSMGCMSCTPKHILN